MVLHRLISIPTVTWKWATGVLHPFLFMLWNIMLQLCIRSCSPMYCHAALFVDSLSSVWVSTNNWIFCMLDWESWCRHWRARTVKVAEWSELRFCLNRTNDCLRNRSKIIALLTIFQDGVYIECATIWMEQHSSSFHRFRGLQFCPRNLAMQVLVSTPLQSNYADFHVLFALSRWSL